ncbi:hypothetical protein M011DRAFT_464079 [Sporormia fimetaria CBS 119925]|uniref:Uncharacterized protein n=1 Tax=Sporormia fimetaria CBS 119925 TaxID=1340428 RepID=A0A6A6VNM4_9PLEO|nr:hypothetical protein M011DRAFT_464079 [Sporormia fimetaria CBS 119925]
MPNVLILSFDGFSFSSRQLYETLLPKILSRAIAHEALTIDDALKFIDTGWPSVILITDAVILNGSEESNRLLEAVHQITERGCTTISAGCFVSDAEVEDLNAAFRRFGLRWKAGTYGVMDTVVGLPDPNAIKLSNCIRAFRGEAVFLHGVPQSEAVYVTTNVGRQLVYAAFGSLGFGKIGYVGDLRYAEEGERIVLAMCHLDRPDFQTVRATSRNHTNGSLMTNPLVYRSFTA